MSVLDKPAAPLPPPPATRVAAHLRQTTRDTFHQLAQVFNQGAKQFWKNPRATPAEIAAALGPQAVEVFQLHGKIGALLAQVKPESIAEGVAVVGQFTYNEDGTVTVLENPPPIPVDPAPELDVPFETPEQLVE